MDEGRFNKKKDRFVRIAQEASEQLSLIHIFNTAELQKQSRQLTSEKMKLYDDYKDGRIDRDSYKQRAEKIKMCIRDRKSTFQSLLVRQNG